ncbi:MAG: helix-turn-helix transcriptional regulator [Clostridia bacterium]|nr:helix-turn-helix transcriptional regulator [Clostridia bacterium]
MITGNRLRDMREDRDLTQKVLADYLMIHQTTYSDYEIGKLNVPIDVFIAHAKYYDTSIDYFAGMTNNPKPYR